MTRLSKWLLALVALPGIAFAQDPEPTIEMEGDSPLPPDGVPAMPDPTVTVGFSKATWPKSYILRTLNIYKGGFEVTPLLGLQYTAGQDAMPPAMDVDSKVAIGLGVEARYGLDDKMELLAQYKSVTFTPDFSAEGTISAGVGYSVLQNAAGGKLDIEVKGLVAFDLGATTLGIVGAADVRYKVTPKIWIGTPITTPGLTLGIVGKDIPAAPPEPERTERVIKLDIPFAAGFQATPELHVQLTTALLSIGISDSDTGFFGADFIPVTLSALYAVNEMIDGLVALDLGELRSGAGDKLGITVGANIRL